MFNYWHENIILTNRFEDSSELSMDQVFIL